MNGRIIGYTNTTRANTNQRQECGIYTMFGARTLFRIHFNLIELPNDGNNEEKRQDRCLEIATCTIAKIRLTTTDATTAHICCRYAR